MLGLTLNAPAMAQSCDDDSRPLVLNDRLGRQAERRLSYPFDTTPHLCIQNIGGADHGEADADVKQR